MNYDKGSLPMKSLIPERHKCQWNSCPGVYQDGDDIVIIGDLISPEGCAELGISPSEGEAVVRISAELLVGAMKGFSSLD